MRTIFAKMIDSTVDFDALVNAARNFEITGHLNSTSTFASNSDSDEDSSPLDVDKMNALKQMVEQIMREMEESIINTLTK